MPTDSNSSTVHIFGFVFPYISASMILSKFQHINEFISLPAFHASALHLLKYFLATHAGSIYIFCMLLASIARCSYILMPNLVLLGREMFPIKPKNLLQLTSTTRLDALHGTIRKSTGKYLL